MLFQAVLIVILTISEYSFGQSVGDQTCGVKIKATGLIVNGTKSKANEWPWLAALKELPTRTFFCGGTLISESRVITAAHCLHTKGSNRAKRPDEVLVHLGKHNLYKAENNSKVFWPVEILIHPDWNPSTLRYDADLAVLITDVPIHFTDYIFPVCMWSFPIDDDSIEGTVVGWGASERTHLASYEKTPRQVLVKRVPSAACYEEFYRIASISSNRTFCAGGSTISSGPCTGDSGGGFFVNVEGVWYIQGIVSAAFTTKDGQCDVSKYGIFTNINEFRTWLKHKSEAFNFVVNCDEGYDATTSTCKLLFLTIIHPFTSLSLNKTSEVASRDVKTCDIAYAKMKYFPTNLGSLFPNLERIRAYRVQLEFAERSAFENMPNLNQLVIRNNKLTAIPRDVFFELSALEILELSHNDLAAFHEDTLIKNPMLLELDAKSNRIELIYPGTFRNNKKMRLIQLSNNEIKFIGADIFKGLDKLERVDLSQNFLRRIPSDLFKDTVNLVSLTIAGNRLAELEGVRTFQRCLKLIEISAQDNQITKLPQDLFKNNDALRSIDFSKNRITEIDAILNNGRPYELLDFRSNDCINSVYHADNSTTSLRDFIEMIKKDCGEFSSDSFGDW